MSSEDSNLIQSIAEALQKRHWTMATAESCTGGMIAAALTARPGSSAWFAGSLVTYAVAWKQRLLGVADEILEREGVVSEATVAAMLQGLRERHGVEAGIAVSGIAGPGGAEPGKPVGTVVIGAFAGAAQRLRTGHFDGDREGVRRGATTCALRLLATTLQEIP